MELYRIIERLILLSILTMITMMISCKSNNSHVARSSDEITVEDSISIALDYQLSHYPCSQYRDIYKNFMQDFFGPGHLLSDTAAANRYLLSELVEEDTFDGPLFEKTGYKGNFYRVNLSLIRDSIIPYEVFFNCFVKSISNIVPPSDEDWMKIWSKIDNVITDEGITFPNETADRQDLREQFEKGNFVVHHSQGYNDSVHFHYRIISRDIFEKEIFPLLNYPVE